MLSNRVVLAVAIALMQPLQKQCELVQCDCKKPQCDCKRFNLNVESRNANVGSHNPNVSLCNAIVSSHTANATVVIPQGTGFTQKVRTQALAGSLNSLKLRQFDRLMMLRCGSARELIPG